ncbi:MAG TPA: hypothetical protein VJ890_21280 [Vineibacter sp.]|nr:hypothetical protein [Vineibacter sp.]
MGAIAGIVVTVVGLVVKLWLAARQNTARLLGRAETREAQARETLDAAKEARDAEDAVARLPDSAVDDELRRWERKAGDRQ